MTRPRQCFYIPTAPYDDNGFVPSLVTEGQPGHAPLIGHGRHAAPWYWGKTYEDAREVARRENARLGLSDDDVLAIVASSMAAR